MSRNEVIQVAFTAQEAARVRANAEIQGLSQSAYVRRIVVSTLGAYAWWVRPMDPPMEVRAVRSMGQINMSRHDPNFYLERVGEIGSEYHVYFPDKTPVNFEALLAECGDMYREIRDGRLVLYGDHSDLRTIEESIGDANRGGQLRWRLGFDRRSDYEIFRPPQVTASP